jgi:hypothetical protein
LIERLAGFFDKKVSAVRRIVFSRFHPETVKEKINPVDPVEILKLK